jgi:hypothetical protein
VRERERERERKEEERGRERKRESQKGNYHTLFFSCVMVHILEIFNSHGKVDSKQNFKN